MSRAECPVASTTRVASMVVPSRRVTPRIAIVRDDQPGHAGTEAHLTARAQDALAHGGDDVGQLVGADVRMSIDEDVGARAVGHEGREDPRDLLALAAPRVELAVAVRSSAAFPEAVVAVGIDAPRAA